MDVGTLGYPVFVSDGIIGELYEPSIRCIVLEKATLSKLIDETKTMIRYWNTNQDFKRLFVVSAGNFDITADSFSPEILDSLAERERALTNKVNYFMKELRLFNELVVSCGGILVVTSLIPQPIEVDDVVSPNLLAMQEFLSRLFLKINDEIWKFNKNNHRTTLFLKDKLEVRIAKKHGKVREDRVFYGGRRQVKIRLDCFKRDYSQLDNDIKYSLKELVVKHINNNNKFDT